MESILGSLTPEALKLSAEEKCLLASKLLRSVEKGEAKDWEKEIESRIAAYDQGHLKSEPLQDGVARIRQRHLG